MKMPLSEIIDRYTITLLKSQRTDEDVSEEQRKDGAFRIIFDRKFEQELQRTLIELRAEAFVDIKIDP